MDLQQLADDAGYNIATCKKVIVKAIEEGKVKRLDRIHYTFTGNEKPKESTNIEQEPYTLKGHSCLGMTEEFFNEMLEQVKPLLMNGGCSQSQIMKMFRNLSASVVEYFLSKAIRKGMIKEDIGTFTLATDEVQTHP